MIVYHFFGIIQISRGIISYHIMKWISRYWSRYEYHDIYDIWYIMIYHDMNINSKKVIIKWKWIWYLRRWSWSDLKSLLKWSFQCLLYRHLAESFSQAIYFSIWSNVVWLPLCASLASRLDLAKASTRDWDSHGVMAFINKKPCTSPIMAASALP
jgi:hypothetical protein